MALRDGSDRDRGWLDSAGGLSSEAHALVVSSADDAVDAMLGAPSPPAGCRWVVVEHEAVPAWA